VSQRTDHWRKLHDLIQSNAFAKAPRNPRPTVPQGKEGAGIGPAPHLGKSTARVRHLDKILAV